MAELAAAIEADPGNTAREVVRLERGGVLTSRRVGRTKLVRANTAAPFYRPLHDLVTVVMGPVSVLAERLAPVEGIVFADISGHGRPATAVRRGRRRRTLTCSLWGARIETICMTRWWRRRNS